MKFKQDYLIWIIKNNVLKFYIYNYCVKANDDTYNMLNVSGN